MCTAGRDVQVPRRGQHQVEDEQGRPAQRGTPMLPASGPRRSHATAAAQAAHGPLLLSGLAACTPIHGFVRRAGLMCHREALLGPQVNSGFRQSDDLLFRCASPPLQTCIGANGCLVRVPQDFGARSPSSTKMILDPIVAFSLSCIRDGDQYVLARCLRRATRVLPCRVLARSACRFCQRACVVSRVQFRVRG